MTLASDPGTPIYACGSTPTRMRCRPTPAPDFTATRNLAALGPDDERELARLVGNLAGPRYVIGICTWPGCDAAAVDGRCLTHG